MIAFALLIYLLPVILGFLILRSLALRADRKRQPAAYWTVNAIFWVYTLFFAVRIYMALDGASTKSGLSYDIYDFSFVPPGFMKVVGAMAAATLFVFGVVWCFRKPK